ncbi:hypothetical protein D8674_043037 [Pyrus ussuriensis x Pyrus communis]|uniref:Integrase catalytic domain-containing protein n=1 Tax=Pyrus ussuriensis x Pyrus communis TaxID=2448454 RepID=A0A5N5FCH2_9ROSA|nr:hypothetical protein D8674_043037 [Pyrus ussuriensis x Pyrus communis]
MGPTNPNSQWNSLETKKIYEIFNFHPPKKISEVENDEERPHHLFLYEHVTMKNSLPVMLAINKSIEAYNSSHWNRTFLAHHSQELLYKRLHYSFNSIASFFFSSVLKGYKLFDYFDGTVPCPSKFVVSTESGVTKELTDAFQDWETTDLSLLSLLIATLTDDAIEYVIGCKTATEAWTNLEERFASMSRTGINHLKTELHTIQKGGDSMDKYLLRIKTIRDQLMAAGEYVSDNDVMIAALAGLPREYATIRTVILARDSNVTMKEFRALLIGAERENDVVMNSLTHNMAGLYVQGNNGGSSSSLYTNGASSSNCSANEPSSTGGSQMMQPAYVPNQSSYDSGGGCVGHLEQHPQDNSRQHQSSAPFPGPIQRFYSGGQSRGSSTYRSGFKGKGSNYRNNSGWNGNVESRTTLHPECQICQRRGHTAPNCFYRTICGKKGHSALECYHRGNYSYQPSGPPAVLGPTFPGHSSVILPSQGFVPQPPNFAAHCSYQGHAPVMQGMNGPQNMHKPDLSYQVQPAVQGMNVKGSPLYSNAANWIVDIGASHHMTSDLASLHQVSSFEGSEKIKIGNGQGLPIQNAGSAIIKTPSHFIIMKNVLHVPSLAVNLMSVKQLCKDNRCWFICDDINFFVQDKVTREILYKGRSRLHELFQIPVSSWTVPKACIGQLIKSSLWHQRLGHPTNAVMAVMLAKSQIPVSMDNKHTMCTDCIHGKITRKPFDNESSRCILPFDRIHSDVWGSSSVKFIEGYRFYVVFVDDCTRYMWIFPLYNKSEVFLIFFGAQIKCLQSDGGGEFVSHSFKEFMQSKGMVHRISCPCTPQQNGLVERRHRHVVETAITLMNAAGLSQEFWYLSCAHAVYLINRMTSKSLQMNSPYFSLYDKHPSLKDLKIYGSAVFPYLRHYNDSKLQPRSSMCIFLGYASGYKGAICYNLQTQKLVLSKHVIHDESVFPAKCKPSVMSSSQSVPLSVNSTPILVPFRASSEHDSISTELVQLQR